MPGVGCVAGRTQMKPSRKPAPVTLFFSERTRTRLTHGWPAFASLSGSMMNGGPAQGNDASNYAMFQHTLTTGVTFRLCSRCGKTWFPKDPEYRWAMTRPTRNSPSTGSPSPGLVKNPKHVRVKSEVEHRQRPRSEWEFDGQ